MLNNVIILSSNTLLLRPIEPEDLPRVSVLTSDPEMWRYFTNDLSTSEGLEDWVKPAFLKERMQFVVLEKANQTILGSTAFGNYSKRDSRIEIGWTWLSKTAQGTGVNQQMKRMMLKYCFEDLKVIRVEMKTDVLNEPARKALLKLGAVEEGILRSHTLLTNNRRRDTIYYSILANEWRPTTKDLNHPTRP